MWPCPLLAWVVICHILGGPHLVVSAAQSSLNIVQLTTNELTTTDETTTATTATAQATTATALPTITQKATEKATTTFEISTPTTKPEKLEIIAFRQADGDIMYDCQGKMGYTMEGGKAAGKMRTFSCTGWSKNGCDTAGLSNGNINPSSIVTNREIKVFSREHDFAVDDASGGGGGGFWGGGGVTRPTAMNNINGKKYSCKANMKYT